MNNSRSILGDLLRKFLKKIKVSTIFTINPNDLEYCAFQSQRSVIFSIFRSSHPEASIEKYAANLEENTHDEVRF